MNEETDASDVTAGHNRRNGPTIRCTQNMKA